MLNVGVAVEDLTTSRLPVEVEAELIQGATSLLRVLTMRLDSRSELVVPVLLVSVTGVETLG